MANRRIMSLELVDSDKFMEMPVTAQVLYFHLASRADESGYVRNVNAIMRMLNSSQSDFILLIRKEFFCPFTERIKLE